MNGDLESASNLSNSYQIFRYGYVGVVFVCNCMLWETTKRLNRPYLYSGLLVTSLGFYFLLQGSDPGYVCNTIKRGSDRYVLKEEAMELVVEEPQDGYCKRCHAPAPVRSHHCNTCNRCVHKFDHHCDALGTCVGERNHCRFWWVLFFHVLLLTSGITEIWGSGGTVALILKVLGGLALIPLTTLLCIHSYLASSNHTTYELLKYAMDKNFVPPPGSLFQVPYIGRYINNIVSFCCFQDSLIKNRSRTTRIDGIVDCGTTAWSPIVWKQKHFETSPFDLGLEDDILSNRYYNCC